MLSQLGASFKVVELDEMTKKPKISVIEPGLYGPMLIFTTLADDGSEIQ